MEHLWGNATCGKLSSTSHGLHVFVHKKHNKKIKLRMSDEHATLMWMEHACLQINLYSLFTEKHHTSQSLIECNATCGMIMEAFKFLLALGKEKSTITKVLNHKSRIYSQMEVFVEVLTGRMEFNSS